MRIAAVLVALFFAATASAHPGGTDAYGCHTQHSAGWRHCHADADTYGDGKCDGSCPALVALALLASAGIVAWIFWLTHRKPAPKDAPRPGMELVLTPAGPVLRGHW